MLRRRPLRKLEEIAAIDVTGGELRVVQLTDCDVPKVLLRADKQGVMVEMALTPKEAEAFKADLEEVIAWATHSD